MTREEAIDVYNGLINTKIKEAFEFFAPELRESEDERIRKILIDAFEKKNNSFIDELVDCRLTKADILDWIEKQKIFPEKGEGVYSYKDGKIYFLGQWLDNSMYMCDAPVGRDADGHLVYMEDLEGEKQKEQKPISQEDFDAAKHETLWGEQKPVECVKKPHRFCDDTLEAIDKDREMREQHPELYPVEWSEEDENMRNNILRVIQCFEGTVECESNPSLSTSYPLYMREIAWLKSLRPQKNWKPSEEQMEALYKVAYNLIGTGTETDVHLVQLYEQLKKLMEDEK